MSRLSLSQADQRQSNRAYTKSNREDWADLGFRNATFFVHDDERKLILAELEVRKCAAMVAMAESKNTPDNAMLLLSRRNMTALPLPGELATLKAEATTSTARGEVEGMIDIAQNYVKRYRGIEANYEKVTDEARRIIMAAKAVAYSGACAAHLKLARVVMVTAPLKDTTIFGARGEDEATV